MYGIPCEPHCILVEHAAVDQPLVERFLGADEKALRRAAVVSRTPFQRRVPLDELRDSMSRDFVVELEATAFDLFCEYLRELSRRVVGEVEDIAEAPLEALVGFQEAVHARGVARQDHHGVTQGEVPHELVDGPASKVLVAAASEVVGLVHKENATLGLVDLGPGLLLGLPYELSNQISALHLDERGCWLQSAYPLQEIPHEARKDSLATTWVALEDHVVLRRLGHLVLWWLGVLGLTSFHLAPDAVELKAVHEPPEHIFDRLEADNVPQRALELLTAGLHRSPPKRVRHRLLHGVLDRPTKAEEVLLQGESRNVVPWRALDFRLGPGPRPFGTVGRRLTAEVSCELDHIQVQAGPAGYPDDILSVLKVEDAVRRFGSSAIPPAL
mmetsp:Transcript_131657/g.328295  ORF Transcript_131657/g.328295 Transcript_131657/m.328295 type:complete len:385 (-) Transcript_131657:209-1363(-)